MTLGSVLIRKKFLQNIGILCGAVLLLLIAWEGALRTFLSEKSHVHKNFPQGLLSRRDSLLGWIGKSGESGVLSFALNDMDDMDVVMNNEGFWDDTHQLIKPPGVKRLLFLGDSFTIGYGIQKKERFTDLIKNRLPSGYEMINMGMWGYSTDQELILLKEKGLRYHPDVVILSMFLDDLFCTNLFSVNEGIYIKPKFVLTKNGQLKLSNVPVPNNHGRSFVYNMILTRFYKLYNRLEMGSEFQKRGWRSVYDRAYLKQNGYLLALYLLGEIHALLKIHDIHFLLVIIPGKDQIFNPHAYEAGGHVLGIPSERFDLRLPQKVVKLFCKKVGIPVVDLLEAFKEHDCPRKLFFKQDLHWTKEGHRLAAEQILISLKELHYL